MLVLENKLLEYINLEDKKNSFKIYKELIKLYTSTKLDFTSELRALKNYYISLNAILFNNSISFGICTYKLHCKKLYFLEQIEYAKCKENLYELGEKMIVFSLKLKRRENKTDNFIINQALKYIDRNLNANLTLEKLAKHLFISQNYLSFLFSKNMNCSFSEYVSIKKIEKAKKLLEEESLSLLDIALESGFNSQSYFCYVFKQLENISPNQYRNKKE